MDCELVAASAVLHLDSQTGFFKQLAPCRLLWRLVAFQRAGYRLPEVGRLKALQQQDIAA